MKSKVKKTDFEVHESELISSVPSSSHFIETCSKSNEKNLGSWLKIIDNDSLSYITSLFNPLKGKLPEGMALPVCDIVSLCLLINEWESGKEIHTKDSWDVSIPMIPRLRRALLLESIRRDGLIEILNVSILKDDFEIRVKSTKNIDDLLSKWIEKEFEKNGIYWGNFEEIGLTPDLEDEKFD